MRRKDIIVLIFLVGITAILSVFVVFASKRAENVTEVENLAFEELTASVENQKAFFNSLLDEKYAALESLAYYLDVKEDLDFPAEREYSDAVMLANHFNSLCLADLKGKAVSYDGSPEKNVADRPFFKAASAWKGVRAVEYVENADPDGEPAVLIAVPVRHNHVLTGILYAKMEVSFFDEMLLADGFHGSEAVFVTDLDGNVMLRNKNAHRIFRNSNLFDGFLAEGSAENVKNKVLSDMGLGAGGCFSCSPGEKDYIVYAPAGVNDWYIFSVVSDETISQKYAEQNNFVNETVEALNGAFFVLAVSAAVVVIYFIRRYYWTGRKLKRKDLILEANDAFMFSDSVQPIRKLRSSGIAEQIAERAYGSGSIITSLLSDGKVKLYFVSIGILESLGYTEDELNDICEKDISKLIHPDDIAETVETNLRNSHVGDSFQLTVRYKKKNGEYMWINEYSHIFRLEDGTAVCASQFVDISRQKELEQQLRAREEEYRIAASMSRYVIMRYDVKSRTLAVLARGTSGMKFDSLLEDVPEQAIRSGFIAPESIETARKVFSDIDRGVSRKGKTVLALDAGSDSRIWTEISYSAVYDSMDEKPVSAILSFIDVTEKRRAEEFINIGSAFMDYATNAKLVIANLSTGLIEYEAPGTIHRNFTAITGTDDIYKIMQYAAQNVVSPEYAAAFSEFLSVARLKKEFNSGNMEEGLDCVIEGADGAEKWVNFQIRLAKDSFSGDIKAYLVLKDIDVQKNLERELQLEKSERKSTAFEGADSLHGTDGPAKENRQLFARTFGYFDLFVDGKPLHFTNQKEKELLAILIDRNGGTLSAEEAISILWEDEPYGEKQLSRYRKLASRLKSTLAEVGCDDIIITSHGVRHIDVSKIECDYYEVLSSNSKFIKLYQGIYMLNYSWAEETTASLNRLLLFGEES